MKGIYIAIIVLIAIATFTFDAAAQNGRGNGMSNGYSNGTPNGTGNGMGNGSSNGTPNGVGNGTGNGAGNGYGNGAPNGLSNGTSKVEKTRRVPISAEPIVATPQRVGTVGNVSGSGETTHGDYIYKNRTVSQQDRYGYDQNTLRSLSGICLTAGARRCVQ